MIEKAETEINNFMAFFEPILLLECLDMSTVAFWGTRKKKKSKFLGEIWEKLRLRLFLFVTLK